MSFEKTLRVNQLYDAYGELLTQRQQEVFKYYYQEDLSYQEIADILEISRAGVYDTLKRTVDFLEETEIKLGFALKYGKLFEALFALDNAAVNQILNEFEKGGNYE